MEKKHCGRCKEIKVINEFYKSKQTKNGYSSWCKQCYKEYRTKWRNNNRERVRELNRKYGKGRKRDPIKIKNSFLKKKFGITVDYINNLTEKQNGICAICLKQPNGRWKSLNLDHNHETGTLRGMLCISCNRVLGLVGDNIDTLQRAIVYLKKYDY